MPKTVVKPKSSCRRDSEFLSVAPEICVFFACFDLVEELRRLERMVKACGAEHNAVLVRFEGVLRDLTEVVENTHRFDIVLPVMEYRTFSPFFWSWFNWWADYTKGMTRRRMARIEQLARQGLALAEDLRPKGSWLRCRQTPPLRLVTT